MNSSALLEETTQLEMDNPRKEQEELNLNELNSFLNSIMNKCRSKFFYYRQMQMLIGNTADAMTEISNLKKANENLKQTNEQLKGSIQTTSNENSNLKQQNQQPDFCHLVLKFPSMTHCIVSINLECHRIQHSIVINVIQKIFYTKS